MYGCLVKYPNDCTAIYDSEGSVFEVFYNTVGQYTGVKDENGTEIYEGDIVRHWGHCRNENTAVTFEKGAFIIGFRDIGLYPKEPRYLRHYAKHIEVVGNIHQNRDLLE